MWDAKGDTTYPELIIDTIKNKIIMKWDENWMVSATAPVVYDPEFGYSTFAASGIDLSVCRGTVNAANTYTASTGDVLLATYAKAYESDAADSLYFDIGLYDVNGTPMLNNRIRVDRLYAITSTPRQWSTYQYGGAFSQVLTNGTTYGLAVGNAEITTAVSVNYDAGGTRTFSASATLDDPWVSASTNTYQYNIVGIYAEAGSPFILGVGIYDAQMIELNSVSPQLNNWKDLSRQSQIYDDNSATGRYTILVKFPTLKDSLYNRTVTDATLKIVQDEYVGAGNMDVSVFGLLRYYEWKEATYDSAEYDPDGVDWTSDGAIGSGTDVTASSYLTFDAKLDTTEEGSDVFYYMDVTTLVQTWAADTSLAQGFLLRAVQNSAVNNYINMGNGFSSRMLWRPSLTITYSTPSGGQKVMFKP